MLRLPALVFAGLLSWLAAPTLVQAQASDLIRYEVQVKPGDPFALAHQSNAGAQPVKARRGQTILVTFKAFPKEEFHTYPFTKKTRGQPDSQLSEIKKFDAPNGIKMLWPLVEAEPDIVEEKGLGYFLEHRAPFQVTQEVAILPDATPGSVTLTWSIYNLVCDEGGSCTPVDTEVKATLEISNDAPLPVSAELERRLKEKKPPPGEIALGSDANPPPVKADASTPSPTPNTADLRVRGAIDVSHEKYRDSMLALAKRIVNSKGITAAGGETDLWGFILAGVFWGAISLITPCVFPMIPITVSFFLKQSEKEHHQPITMALVYSATIIIVLTLAAVFLLSLFRWLSIDPIMNYAMGALFIFFALSLFGWYDIELPSGLARFTSAREGQGGLVGTIFMALTFTIISFACVAPFLGGFGGTAGGTDRPLWHTLLGGLAFSVTFAAPFFFLALFPTLLKKMPKSGSWLNSVKVVMGFLEFAAAFKFFRTAEIVQTSSPTLFTYDFCLGVWIALCFMCGLYLLGVYRLPHDSPAE